MSHFTVAPNSGSWAPSTPRKAQIRDGRFQLRVLSHAAEYEGNILDGMTPNHQDAVAGLSQVALLRKTVLEEREYAERRGAFREARGDQQRCSGQRPRLPDWSADCRVRIVARFLATARQQGPPGCMQSGSGA